MPQTHKLIVFFQTSWCFLYGHLTWVASISFNTLRFLVSSSFGEQTFVAFTGSFKKPSATNPTHLAMFANPRVPVLSKSVSVSLQLCYFQTSRGARYTHPPNKKGRPSMRECHALLAKNECIKWVTLSTSSLPTITVENLKLVLETWPLDDHVLEFHTK